LDGHEPSRATSAAAPIVVICGPTASGKSGLALQLAEHVACELVSADSVQVYRGLDIGSAKPTAAEREAVPHHLVDVADPSEVYDAGRFVEEADAAIAAIRAQGRLPVVVGGTGMYLRALLYGMIDAPPRDDALRAELQLRVEAEGTPALHAELVAVDPEAAVRIHPNDAVRVVRGLEVFALTGRPQSAFFEAHDVKARAPRYAAVQVALAPARPVLYGRIDARVLDMFARGWLAEVEALLKAGVDPDAGPMRTLGYRAIVDFLLGRPGAARDEAALRVEIQRDHHHYAKRQLTWFRGQRELRWFDSRGPALRELTAAVAVARGDRR